MASGTYRVKLTQIPQRIDNLGSSANITNTIKLLNGQAQFWYMPTTAAPAAADLDKGYPKTFTPEDERSNEVQVSMGATESLWASGTAELSIMARAT